MLEILDTAGTVSMPFLYIVYFAVEKTQFAAMRDLYIKNGHGFALVYSITSQSTFNEVSEYRDQVLRVKEIETVNKLTITAHSVMLTVQIPMILVGNKCDLEDERCVSKSEGFKLANQWNIGFMETSAKSMHNVFEVRKNIKKLI